MEGLFLRRHLEAFVSPLVHHQDIGGLVTMSACLPGSIMLERIRSSRPSIRAWIPCFSGQPDVKSIRASMGIPEFVFLIGTVEG